MKYNFFKFFFYAVSIAFLAWIAVSYMDVLKFQNCGGTDTWWNFFVVMF